RIFIRIAYSYSKPSRFNYFTSMELFFQIISTWIVGFTCDVVWSSFTTIKEFHGTLSNIETIETYSILRIHYNTHFANTTMPNLKHPSDIFYPYSVTRYRIIIEEGSQTHFREKKLKLQPYSLFIEIVKSFAYLTYITNT